VDWRFWNGKSTTAMWIKRNRPRLGRRRRGTNRSGISAQLSLPAVAISATCRWLKKMSGEVWIGRPCKRSIRTFDMAGTLHAPNLIIHHHGSYFRWPWALVRTPPSTKISRWTRYAGSASVKSPNEDS